MTGDRTSSSPERRRTNRLARTLGRYVNHENVFVRAVSFWGFCAVVFPLVWVGSYHVLPEGLLRGTSLAYFAPIETSETDTTFLRIFGWNLLLSGGIIVVANTFRSVNTPMGYLVDLVG